MQRQCEHAPANRQQDIAIQIFEGISDLRWQIVNMTLSLVILPGTNKGEVEWPKTIAIFFEMTSIS